MTLVMIIEAMLGKFISSRAAAPDGATWWGTEVLRLLLVEKAAIESSPDFSRGSRVQVVLNELSAIAEKCFEDMRDGKGEMGAAMLKLFEAAENPDDPAFKEMNAGEAQMVTSAISAFKFSLQQGGSTDGENGRPADGSA